MSTEYDCEKIKTIIQKVRNTINKYDKKMNQLSSQISIDIEIPVQDLKNYENYVEQRIQEHIHLKNCISRTTIEKAERTRNSARLAVLKKMLF